MKSIKRNKLQAAGWKVGSVQEFLNLSKEDLALIEMKRTLIEKIKEIRRTNKISQQSLASLLESSQSRIAKLESGEPGISLDLICRAMFALGLNQRDIAKVMSRNS